MTAAPDLDPYVLARHVDTLTWTQLDHIGQHLLARLAIVAEAPGARIQPDLIHHAKPGAQPPTSSPMCDCGCPSLRDHWHHKFTLAATRDLAAGQDPKHLRSAILLAALDLDQTLRTPIRTTLDHEREQRHERTERIVSDYDRLPPDVVAHLETRRSGLHLTPTAVKQARRENDRHTQTGLPIPPRADRKQQAIEQRYTGRTQAQVAIDMDVAPSTILRWWQAADHDLATT